MTRGKSFGGHEFVADVEYSVLEKQSRGGFKVAHLRIDPSVAVSQDLLTLLMGDGRKWDFYAVNEGIGVVTGGPY